MSETPRVDAATFTINWDDDIRRHGRYVPYDERAKIELDLAATIEQEKKDE